MSAISLLTAKDQLIWTQRIEKEREAHQPASLDGFSVLGAMGVLDVPRRFKPGHIDPSKAPPDEGFELGSKMRKEVEFRLREKDAPRRDRYLWPDSAYQEHGWFQKDPARGPEKRGRTTLTGAPTTNGIGWRDKMYENKVYKKLAPCGLFSLSAENDKEYHEKPPPPRPVGIGTRPPFSFVSQEALAKVIAKKNEEGGTVRGNSHCHADRRAQSIGVIGSATDPTAKANTVASGTKVLAANRSISEGCLGVMSRGSTIKNADDHICTDSFDSAMKRGRIFANRHPQYKWYVPLGNSDVSQYVDNYTKCFGKPFYGKSSQSR